MTEIERPALFEKVRRSRTFNNLINRFALNQKKVLDAGCSEGHYLANFGPGSVGVTIIDEHIDIGKKLGLDIRKMNLESQNFSMSEQFDVVWANNFFEHMNAPHTFLRNMASVLKDDGILILGVPVVPNITFLRHFKKFRGAYAVSHVNFFYRRTLIDTVKAAGFDVVEARLFYVKSPLLDWFFNFIAPHMYVIATPDLNFEYAHKRIRSLEGYEGYDTEVKTLR